MRATISECSPYVNILFRSPCCGLTPAHPHLDPATRRGLNQTRKELPTALTRRWRASALYVLGIQPRIPYGVQNPKGLPALAHERSV